MNAFLICSVEPISTDPFFLGQLIHQPPKFPMKGGKFFQSMNSCQDISATNFPRSADDVKGFLELGYSLQGASLNVAQSGGAASNSRRFSQSSLSSLAK